MRITPATSHDAPWDRGRTDDDGPREGQCREISVYPRGHCFAQAPPRILAGRHWLPSSRLFPVRGCPCSRAGTAMRFTNRFRTRTSTKHTLASPSRPHHQTQGSCDPHQPCQQQSCRPSAASQAEAEGRTRYHVHSPWFWHRRRTAAELFCSTGSPT